MIPNYKKENNDNSKNQALSFVSMDITTKNDQFKNCKIEEKLKENEILPEVDN